VQQGSGVALGTFLTSDNLPNKFNNFQLVLNLTNDPILGHEVHLFAANQMQ
jgi:hypothetical protein